VETFLRIAAPRMTRSALMGTDSNLGISRYASSTPFEFSESQTRAVKSAAWSVREANSFACRLKRVTQSELHDTWQIEGTGEVLTHGTCVGKSQVEGTGVEADGIGDIEDVPGKAE
jgi:hypothetical protein